MKSNEFKPLHLTWKRLLGNQHDTTVCDALIFETSSAVISSQSSVSSIAVSTADTTLLSNLDGAIQFRLPQNIAITRLSLYQIDYVIHSSRVLCLLVEARMRSIDRSKRSKYRISSGVELSLLSEKRTSSWIASRASEAAGGGTSSP